MVALQQEPLLNGENSLLHQSHPSMAPGDGGAGQSREDSCHVLNAMREMISGVDPKSPFLYHVTFRVGTEYLQPGMPAAIFAREVG
jgi:hypothetical protein